MSRVGRARDLCGKRYFLTVFTDTFDDKVYVKLFLAIKGYTP